MEFFNKAKAVRLRSHLDKYLFADDDEETIRQSRNGSSLKARWTVEFVEGKSHVIRLKSFHGWYLAASEEPFLLGMTGKKVVQSAPASKRDCSVAWEPIKEGGYVKLRTKEGGKFLRANGGTPPWRNSVTHDFPHRTATQDWVLWDVEVMDVLATDFDSFQSSKSTASSFSLLYQDDFTGLNAHSPPISFDESPHSFGRQNGVEFTNSDTRTLAIASNKSLNTFRRESGMEFFDKAKAVRLQNIHGKYLVADDDESNVCQSRNGSSQKARWAVEFINGKPNKIRLKSCYGLYLIATDDPFLLGMTGKKVVQYLPATKMESSTEWEPIRDGFHLKLRTSDGNFLRANWGPPPWRNSVTHDIPHRSATQDWVLWGVEVVDIITSDEFDSLPSFASSLSSFPSSAGEYTDSPEFGLPMVLTGRSTELSMTKGSGMELFQNAKTIRLKSHHDKYLLADDDSESVFQDRDPSAKTGIWIVEFVQGAANLVRLKSVYGKYLTATDQEKILGLTGRKVLQTVPRNLDSSVEWEPIRDGFKVKLKTRYGNFLRANGGVPPWRNSITHDIPHRHLDWILWEVNIVDKNEDLPKTVARLESLEVDLSSSSFHLRSHSSSRLETSDSFGGSPAKSDGRIIYYSVADDEGNVDDAIEWPSFNFKGNVLEELAQKLEEETGLEDIFVCLRNPVNGKLYPLRLALPPNNATMNIVIIPSTSRAAREFAPEACSSPK